MSTNGDYLHLRDWYFKPHYFPSRAFAGLKQYYDYCFRSQTPEHHNATLSRQAANDARKPWLSTTMRERYRKEFQHLRKLRRITEGKDVRPIPAGKQRIECDECDTFEDLGSEVDERTLEDSGWYLGPTQTLCPAHAE